MRQKELMKACWKMCAVLLFPVFVLSASTCRAQKSFTVPSVAIPHLPLAAADAQGFTPAGWKVQTQEAGDLNGDGRPDLAFVLHEADPKLVLRNGALGTRELDTNPRILAVAFAQPEGGYKLAAQNSTLIPRSVRPDQEDNFDEEGSLHVARGAFSVKLHYFSSAGGWDTGSTAFTFRWQNNRFELIGVLREIFAVSDVVLVTAGSISGGPSKSRSFALPKKPLRTLDDVGDGMEFEVPGAS